MKFKKETFIFVTSLVLIFVIGYINILLSNKDIENPKVDEASINKLQEDYLSEYLENDGSENDLASSGKETAKSKDAKEAEDKKVSTENDETLATDDKDSKDSKDNKEAKTNKDDKDKVAEGNEIIDVDANNDIAASKTIDEADGSFENFKISKAQSNLDLVDQLENNISNETLSKETIAKFEQLLVEKNNQIQMEKDIEVMLKSKGYEEVVAVVSNNSIKIVTNRSIEKGDATKILNIVKSETNFEPKQIKIVKFDNN